MKTALVLFAFALAGCKESKPVVDAPSSPAAPTAEAPMEKNKAEKYISALQADVKRAQEAKEKADAANKKAQEANKLTQ